MEKSKLNSFVKRAVTAIIFAPLIVYVLYLGAPFVNLFFFMCGAAMAWEWANMVPNKKPVLYAVIYAYAAAVFSIFGILYLPLSAGVLLILAGLMFWKARGEEHCALLMLGLLYIAIGFGSLVAVYEIAGKFMLLWYVLVVWGVDIGGYLVGSTLKGPKLAPSISPNKTWSGLIGGMALSALVSVVYTEVVHFDYSGVMAVVAAVVALVAQIGDLIESKIKRFLGIKDSSNLIPGHGGVFDRVDGLLFAAPFFLSAMLIFFFML